MSDRADGTCSVKPRDDRGRRQPGAGLLGALSVLGAGVLFWGAAAAAVTEFVVPSGPVITFQDGRTIDGHIVKIDQTNVVVRSLDGTEQILPRATIERVTFETVSGQELGGELIGWTTGVYEIATSEAAIKVYSALPASLMAKAPAAATEAATAMDALVQTEGGAGEAPGGADAAPGPAAIAEATAAEATAAESSTNDDRRTAAAPDAEEANTDVAAAGQDAAATPNASLSIEVSVEDSAEDGPPVAFNVALSEPSPNSVVLIYATIDGTAIDGEDYEANRGVLVIRSGEQQARIEAPVIDDSISEGDEHLKLFLTVDPSVAVLKNSEIVATIKDND